MADFQSGAGFASVLLATPDAGLQERLQEDLAQVKCAVLPLASLGETGKAAKVLRFDRIILDLALCRTPRDLAEFAAHLEPGQRLVVLHEPEQAFRAMGLNPRCQIRPVARSSHPGILVNRLRAALDGESRDLGIESPTRRNVSILLVDPDPVAQDLILHTLLSQGCLAVNIPNPVEAAHTAEGIHFDVLMMDAMLPFGGARRLADSLSGINPRLKVLFLSHHPKETLISSGVCPPEARIMGKPLGRAAFLAAFDSLMLTGTEWKRTSPGGRDSR